MSSSPYLPAGLLIVGGFVLAGLAVFSWRRRSVDAGTELTALLLVSTIWVLAAAAEHLTPSGEGKIFASKIQYLGILSLPPAILVTVLAAVGRKSWVSPCLRIAAPFAIVFFTLVATNELHGGVWSRVELQSRAPFPMLAIEYGPIFWGINLYSHSQLVLAALLLLPGFWNNRHLDSTFAYVGIFAPWVANVLYVSRLSPFAEMDITPFGLVVTGLAFTAALHGSGNIFSTVKIANRDVLEQISDLVLVFDDKGRLLSANRAARHLLNPTSLPARIGDALGQHPSLIAYLAQDRPDHEPEATIDIDIDVRGESRTFDARSMPILSSRPNRLGTVVVLRDITDRRASEDEVRSHRQQLRQIVDLIPHPIYARDEEGRFIIVNDACAGAYGMTGVEMEGQLMSSLHSDSDELKRILRNDRRVIESQESLTTEEVFRNGTSDARTYKTTKIPFTRDGATSAAIVAMSIDVTVEKERARMLEFLASTDPLTNLSNRRHFYDVLETTLETSDQTGRRSALLFLDLDRFKMVNDNYGHPIGDEILRQVASRIEERVWLGDESVFVRTGSDQPTVSRLGGDEFMVLFPSINDSSQTADVAQRLMDSFAEPFDVGPDRLQLGASIGIAIYPEDGSDSETLVRHCDQALTSAKRSRRGRIEFYNAEISAAEERRHSLEVALRKAIELNEFTMHFQPIRDAQTTRLVGAEALIRWTSKDLGVVTPDEFIPVAEESGLVVPIGLIVVESVCKQMANWRNQGFVLPRVSINLSARQLVEPDSFHQIEKIILGAGIGGDSIEFELTEGSILSENPIVEETLTAFQEMGASLALDDFGTGYSSLSHLRRFSFQRLKIDKSFVGGLGTEDGDEELVRAVIALANRLNIQTVAEGVETEEQLNFLRAEGCDFVQGYLLGRPMPAADFERFLDREKPED